MAKIIGRSLLLALAVVLLICAFAWRTSAEPYFKRQLTPPEQRDIKDAVRKLRNSTDDLSLAAQLEKLASYRHESTLIYIAEYLGPAYGYVVRLSAADAIGRIGSPNGVNHLMSVYLRDETPASLKVSCLGGISAISTEALKIDDQAFRRDAEQKMQLLLPLARSYFQSFGRGDPQLMDAIDEWGAILTLLHGDRQAESAIIVLLKSNSLTPELKCRLSRLYRVVPAFDADSLASALIQQFRVNTNHRLKTAILEALGNINRGRALLLNVALTSNYIFLRRTAVESLMKYQREIPMIELVPLLKELDAEALELVYSLVVKRLENGNIADYCTYGINNANPVISGRSCTVLRMAINNWKHEKKDGPWVRSVTTASPVLLELMETNKPLPPVVLKEAYMTWLSLFPPGLEPRSEYDWNAPFDRRREMVQQLRTESKRIQDGIVQAIRENCDNDVPVPSPSPTATMTVSPQPSRTPLRSPVPPVVSPSPGPSCTPHETTRPSQPPSTSPSVTATPVPTRTRDPLPPPPRTTPIRLPESPMPRPSPSVEPSPSRSPQPVPTPEPTHDHPD